MSIPQYFDLFHYFEGKTLAAGVVESLFGRCMRQMQVELVGRVEDERLILEETFQYDDGETDRRVWTIERLDEFTYRGTADDVNGAAMGKVEGNRLQWQYQLALPVGDRIINVNFDDKMYLMDDQLLVNRARMRKWGIPVASVTLAFRPVD